MALLYILLAIVLLALAWVAFSVVLTNHLKKGRGPYSDIVRQICTPDNTREYAEVDAWGTYTKDGKRYLVEDDGKYAQWKHKKWVVRALLTYENSGDSFIRRYYYDTRADAMQTVRSCESSGNPVELLLSKDDLTTPTNLIDDDGWLTDEYGNQYKPNA